MNKFKYNFVQLYFILYDWWRTFILKQQDCDNCKYYGGLMCTHVDENWNCLGWKRKSFNPLKHWQYQRLIRRMSKIESKINK